MSTNSSLALGMTLLAGAAIGAFGVSGLHAQNRPGAYVIVDISEITNADAFKALIPKTGPALEAFQGHYIVRTDKITALDGTPPKRVVVVAFDSVDKAKAWSASAAQKEVDDIRMKSSKSRSFIAEGM